MSIPHKLSFHLTYRSDFEKIPPVFTRNYEYEKKFVKSHWEGGETIKLAQIG